MAKKQERDQSTLYILSPSDEEYHAAFLKILNSILGLKLEEKDLSPGVLMGVMELIVVQNLVDEKESVEIEMLLKAIYSTGTESVSPNRYKQHAQEYEVRYIKKAPEQIEVGNAIDDSFVSLIAPACSTETCYRIPVTATIRLVIESVNLVVKMFQHLVNMIHLLSLHIDSMEQVYSFWNKDAVFIPFLAPIITCAFAFLICFEVLIVLSHVIFLRNEAQKNLSASSRALAALRKDDRWIRMATYAPLCAGSALVWAGMISMIAATQILAGAYIFLSLLKVCKLSLEIHQLKELKKASIGEQHALTNPNDYTTVLDEKIKLLESKRCDMGVVAAGFSIALGCSIVATMLCPPAAAAFAAAAIAVSVVVALVMVYQKVSAKTIKDFNQQTASVENDDVEAKDRPAKNRGFFRGK